MFQAFRPAAHAVAAVALMSGIALALPALAQSSPSTGTPTTTSPSTTSPSTTSPSTTSPSATAPSTPSPSVASPATVPASPGTAAPTASASAPSASTHATAAAAPAEKAAKHSARVEAHITDLKKKLQITDAQSSQWDSFAQVMRDNGEAMEQALQERDASKGISAVQDLQSYAKIAQTHADGVQKLATAFQPLYDSLSPAQKKNADKIFEQNRHGPMQAEKNKKS